MLHSLLLWISGIVTIVIMDIIWLGTLMSGFYLRELNPLLRLSDGKMDANIPAAFAVYACMSLGMIVFVLPKTGGILSKAFLWGGLFGLVLYSVYEFTNYALVAKWTLPVVIVDVLWGIFLCGVTSAVLLWLDRVLP